MSESDAAVVDCLIVAWEQLDHEAVGRCFSEDGVWHNMPFAPIAGRAAIGAAVQKFLVGMAAVKFEIRNSVLVRPGLIANERVDVFTKADGSVIRLPVSGYFELRDGLVIEWRDYFDGSAFAPS